MTKSILSVGIDIGTSTTQLILSRLLLENRAAAFTIPRFSITEKTVIYESRIHNTPLLSDTVIDAEAIRHIVKEEYDKSGVEQSSIQTGAVIITGETARKENAQEVLTSLSGFAGDFVVATAGPDLESILAAKGAGIDRYSEKHNCLVLNFDIGGGTSNLALYRNGTLDSVGCFNVGGRLIKLSGFGEITYLSPVIANRFPLRIGQKVSPADLQPVIRELVLALEEAAQLRPKSELYHHYLSSAGIVWSEKPLFSFSGGVADLIYSESPPDWLAYGDIGVLLGQAIRNSALFQSEHIRGNETIRATVVGAGAHATDVSGSTIQYQGTQLPVKNLPVISFSDIEHDLSALQLKIKDRLGWYQENRQYEPVILSFTGISNPTFSDVQSLANAIISGTEQYVSSGHPLFVCVENDMAKALGQCLLTKMKPPKQLICLDSLHLQTGQYLDIGLPLADGAVLPVVIKTLIFSS